MHLWWADVNPQPPEEGHEEIHHAVEHEVACPANVQIDEANRRSDSRTPVWHQKKKVIRVRVKAGSIFELVLLIVVVTKGGVILVLFIAFGRSVIV